MPQEQGAAFSEVLKGYRKQQGYTQAQAAAMLGYSKETIAAWECGRRFPTHDDIPRLAGLLGLDTSTVTRAVNEPRIAAYTRRMYGKKASEQQEEVSPSLPASPQKSGKQAGVLAGQDMPRASRRELLYQASGFMSGALIAPDVLEQVLLDRLTRVLSKPSSIDETTLSYLENRTASYWRDRHSAALASCDLVSYVIEHLQKVIVLLEGSLLPTTRMQLCALASGIAQLVGELFLDMAYYAQARKFHEAAIIAAQEACNPMLEAVAWGRMSLAWTYSKDAPKALTCVQQARHLAVGNGTLPIRAWLAAIEAEVQANLSSSDACLKALDEAECIEDRQYSPQDNYLIHFDQSLLGGYKGVCFRKLYRPEEARSIIFLEKARDILKGALASLEPALIQRQPTFLADLADTYLRRGDIEGACGQAVQAATIAAQIKLQKVVQRLFTLREELEPWKDTSYVKVLDGHLAPLVNTPRTSFSPGHHRSEWWFR